MKKFKFNRSKFILGVSIVLFALKAYLGGVFGYFLAKFFTKRTGSLIFDLGDYKFHLHHWLVSTIALALAVAYDVGPLMNQLFLGFMGGVIYEGISSYSDWHQVLVRKKS